MLPSFDRMPYNQLGYCELRLSLLPVLRMLLIVDVSFTAAMSNVADNSCRVWSWRAMQFVDIIIFILGTGFKKIPLKCGNYVYLVNMAIRSDVQCTDTNSRSTRTHTYSLK